MADTVYVLNQGRIDYGGTPDGLTSNELFQRYLGGTPVVEATNRGTKP